MKISRNSGPREVCIDMVETFNWLIGVSVDSISFEEHIVCVSGSLRDGKNVLIIWREHDEFDNDSLMSWFVEQGFNTEEQDFDLVYVNGDSTLLTIRQEGHTWDCRVIEVDFNSLMFES
jgi:adenine-specific DNA-methyltransferase